MSADRSSSESKSIAPAEIEVLRYVVDNAPATARSVAEAMAERKGFARSTTQTLLERLRKKGHLVRTQEHGVNVYAPGKGKADFLTRLVGEFFDSTLGGSSSPFLAFLTQRAHLTPTEEAELRKILEKLEKGGGK